jgi:hypothetical protein
MGYKPLGLTSIHRTGRTLYGATYNGSKTTKNISTPLNRCQLISLWCILYPDCWFNKYIFKKTPWSGVLPERLTGPRLKYPSFYGTRSLLPHSQVTTVYTSSHIFNSIHPSTLRSFKWYLSFRFPHQNPICTSPVPRTFHMPRPSHSSWFDHLDDVWLVQSIKLLVT